VQKNVKALGFHSETLDLYDEFAHHTRTAPRELARAGRRQAKECFLFLVTFSLFIDIKEKK